MSILFLAAAAVAQPPVSIGELDWASLPPLRRKPAPFDGSAARAHMIKIIKSK